MANLADVRTGLGARLRTVAGLNVYEHWPDQATPPAVIVKAESGQYEQTFGADKTVLLFEVHVVVGLAGGLVNAERAIELYLSNTGASSIRAAIAGDRKLGGNADYCLMRGWREYDSKEIAGVEYLAAIVDVEVWVS